jgi:hypothetical protein
MKEDLIAIALIIVISPIAALTAGGLACLIS